MRAKTAIQTLGGLNKAGVDLSLRAFKKANGSQEGAD